MGKKIFRLARDLFMPQCGWLPYFTNISQVPAPCFYNWSWEVGESNTQNPPRFNLFLYNASQSIFHFGERR